MTNADRIARALQLEAKAVEAAKRWPETPSIARNLRWAARAQRRRVAETCSRAAA
ncbi:hypothetical protein LZK98_11760 [Sphingomonas cannabina]|uniref:hypothetical protein n=1 Tax=Sphingomonas cannabina TaxID=2899123 RepID=UPI001F271897|nr:hypothetical protein [Sphingomonas cannabina]UIJ43767.1 hypothetical protein LZK98_11760 [Sphingomonas cannabina]